MPIYEYHCKACGSSHELLQKHSDAPATVCPDCKAAALTKTVSAPVFRLAGSGWYETDFKTGAKKNLTGEGGAPAAEAAPATSPAPASSASATSTAPAPAPAAPAVAPAPVAKPAASGSAATP